ncbi:hypothetical protein BCV69DRAFT_313506 [Microstroma glucosiphilum]|uniref:Calcipressin-domain-containing protein n=1 Tax=Pseudomicrostroma glucosiphilum TaxID=1684307 RepID=A0A316U378_9BASI|nr:hypothetical protein BCV69DRAFT_313506 [Pseudomicrostroma glucosiphilum]PWN19762.1 hypothetical protein BCV69DRAFT_313506 [Pseudomicrostroma glucosiphilum]
MSSSDIKIRPISEPPAYLTPEQHEAATSTTPDSFSNISPKLVLGLEQVTIHAEPSLAGILNGSGRFWVTEESVSYLPSSSQGFSLPYPLIALHAVSSTLPAALSSTGQTQCIYCQIDDAGAELQDGQTEDEDGVEEEMGLREMWIVPSRSEDVEPLFLALSHCASLHPSTSDGDDDGNPFASMGPFGTGANGSEGGLQFEDAEEEGGAELSDTGRFQLARLDAMLGGDSDEDEEERTSSFARASSPELGQASVVEGSQETTNALLLVSHPQPLPSLFSAPLLQSLLALLDAYAPVVGWDPHPDEGRMRVVFDDRVGSSENRKATSGSADSPISRIIQTLNGLALETTEEHQGPDPTLVVERLPRVDITSLLPSQLSGGLPSIAVPATTLHSTSTFHPTDHLLPPITDRNFLISPPGSPPIGWEPIKEDPPNRETLAVDLMEALRKLGREMGADEAADDDQEGERAAEAEANDSKGRRSAGPGHVHVVLPATHRRLPSLAGDESPLIPAVTVQAYDDDEAGENVSANKSKPDITQVKATVDALRGPSEGYGEGLGLGGGNRITPTGRPPLA